MLIEDLRFVHEDIERLEQAIAERLEWEPPTVNSLRYDTVMEARLTSS